MPWSELDGGKVPQDYSLLISNQVSQILLTQGLTSFLPLLAWFPSSHVFLSPLNTCSCLGAGCPRSPALLCSFSLSHCCCSRLQGGGKYGREVTSPSNRFCHLPSFPFPSSRFAQKKNPAYVGAGFREERTFSKVASLGGVEEGSLLSLPDSL